MVRQKSAEIPSACGDGSFNLLLFMMLQSPLWGFAPCNLCFCGWKCKSKSLWPCWRGGCQFIASNSAAMNRRAKSSGLSLRRLDTNEVADVRRDLRKLTLIFEWMQFLHNVRKSPEPFSFGWRLTSFWVNNIPRSPVRRGWEHICAWL